MLPFAVFLLGCSGPVDSPPRQAGDEGFNGRWIIEPLNRPGGRAMWLEISGAGSDTISGSAIGGGSGGQLDEILDAKIVDGELTYHVDRHVGRGERRRFTSTPSRVRLVGEELHGVTEIRDPAVQWVGRRAPLIDEHDDGSWKDGETVVLFDGKSLDGWSTLREGRDEDWFVADGLLKNRKQADVLATDERFWNFRLEAEYRALPESNSGIGLRGRYEVQVVDDYGRPPSDHTSGALYSRIPPTVNASKPAEEWQTFEITMIGRDLTVVHNDQTVLENVVVEGFTAMATDWREAEPGPITLQGDHGPVEFRKIVVTRLER